MKEDKFEVVMRKLEKAEYDKPVIFSPVERKHLLWYVQYLEDKVYKKSNYKEVV